MMQHNKKSKQIVHIKGQCDCWNMRKIPEHKLMGYLVNERKTRKKERPCLLKTRDPMQKEGKQHQIVQQSRPGKQKSLSQSIIQRQ